MTNDSCGKLVSSFLMNTTPNWEDNGGVFYIYVFICL